MPPAISITTSVTASDNQGLRIDYRLQGDISALRIPTRAPSEARDNLWQHTCCEAFIGDAAAVNTQSYREFNFSPSSCWAAYAFHDYRQRSMDWQAPAAPVLTSTVSADTLHLSVQLPAVLLPDSPQLAIGLCAVIETLDGSKTYWALSHAAVQPDFHLRNSFTLRLPHP
jgi:hypothetical protein